MATSLTLSQTSSIGPEVFFHAPDPLVNPYITDLIEPSPALCSKSLDFSVLRSTPPPVASDQSGLVQKQRSTNCLSDSISSRLLKVFSLVLHFVIVSCVCWLCVFSGSLPACHTQPLMKKPSLDSSIRSNSKLPFLSKVLLLSFLESADVWEKSQSDFIPRSTE